MYLKKFLIIAVAWFGLQFAPSARGEGVHVADFRVGLAGAYEGRGIGNWFPQVAYAPLVDVGPFNLRADIGITALRNSLGSRVGVIHLDAFVQYGFTDVLTVDFGGGVQAWGGGGGINPAVSVAVAFTHLYVGYSYVFMDRNVNIFKAGVKLAAF